VYILLLYRRRKIAQLIQIFRNADLILRRVGILVLRRIICSSAASCQRPSRHFLPIWSVFVEFFDHMILTRFPNPNRSINLPPSSPSLLLSCVTCSPIWWIWIHWLPCPMGARRVTKVTVEDTHNKLKCADVMEASYEVPGRKRR